MIAYYWFHGTCTAKIKNEFNKLNRKVRIENIKRLWSVHLHTVT